MFTSSHCQVSYCAPSRASLLTGLRPDASGLYLNRYVEWREARLNDNQRVFGTKAVATELYDYESDPLERENLANRASYAAVLKEHQAFFDHLLPDLPMRDRQYDILGTGP